MLDFAPVAHAVSVIDDLDRYLCPTDRAIRVGHVSADSDDRAVALIDRGHGNMMELVDVGETLPSNFSSRPAPGELTMRSPVGDNDCVLARQTLGND